jgi:hypothetical protein
MANYGSLVGRAAAVLTTSEVAGALLDLSLSFDNSFSVELDFTIGSLTNVVVRFYGSADGATWRPLSNGTAVLTETITATASRYYMARLSGVRYVYVSVQGTGTVTSSSCTFTYRYQLPLVQTKQDGAPHLG